MGKINLLTSEVANLIAAGEVVDRPASVLKELLENCIDAGASDITAEIKRGGVSLIRVSDNGCGIASEDLPLSIKRHATSKIKEACDLDAIETLGFRGEALAAIAAVSTMRIISKTADAQSGTMLTCDCGQVIDISEVGCADGTTIVVEDLFGKFPARRKFLKKDATEAMAVSAVVEKVAMSHPEIAFHLIIDGENKFSTSGDGKLLNALYALLGRDFAKKLIAVDGSVSGINVSGYVGRSDNVRGNRNYQNVFLNGRYVKSKTVMAALERAYTSYIAPERFPVCALFIDVNPAKVDVNVHPAKLEVKFSDERAVFEAVYYAVRGALEANEERPELELSQAPKKGRDPLRTFEPIGGGGRVQQISLGQTAPKFGGFSDTLAKQDSFSKPESHDTRDAGTFGVGADMLRGSESVRAANIDKDSRNSAPLSGGKTVTPYRPSTPAMDIPHSLDVLASYAASGKQDRNCELRAEGKLDHSTSAASPSPAVPDGSFRLCGEAFNCYVIIERGSELMVIDKHAAHERIIFEDLKERMRDDGRVGSQSLLIPLRVSLSADEASAAKEYRTDIENVGFAFSLDGTAATVTAVPDAISISDAETLLVKMAGELASGTGKPGVTEELRRERALYQLACKAAIKGGRIYGTDQIMWLCRRILELPDITVCPHGRPIAFILKKSELDRRFDRI